MKYYNNETASYAGSNSTSYSRRFPPKPPGYESKEENGKNKKGGSSHSSRHSNNEGQHKSTHDVGTQSEKFSEKDSLDDKTSIGSVASRISSKSQGESIKSSRRTIKSNLSENDNVSQQLSLRSNQAPSLLGLQASRPETVDQASSPIPQTLLNANELNEAQTQSNKQQSVPNKRWSFTQLPLAPPPKPIVQRRAPPRVLVPSNPSRRRSSALTSKEVPAAVDDLDEEEEIVLPLGDVEKPQPRVIDYLVGSFSN